MARKFSVPDHYKSSVVSSLKAERQTSDPKKKDLSPYVLKNNALTIKLARHFGFCFGVENAIAIAYKTLDNNPDKRIFLLSEVIHNPRVNSDLLARGINFLMKTTGERLVEFSSLNPEDIVIVPAFGTTIEIIEELNALGIDPLKYNATCPFVEKVWKRSFSLGEEGYTVVIHGKRNHEETRATFSHASKSAPSIVVKDIKEASLICDYILGKESKEVLEDHFRECTSKNFNFETHLRKIGIVNQTTMLASETLEISTLFRETMIEAYGDADIKSHIADTRDTLCYATNENQTSVLRLRQEPADLALVVGGYNSSNTSHLAELLEEKMPTYFIQDADSLLSSQRISHYDQHTKRIKETENWLLAHSSIEVAITAGASCPDKVVDEVILRLQELHTTSQ